MPSSWGRRTRTWTAGRYVYPDFGPSQPGAKMAGRLLKGTTVSKGGKAVGGTAAEVRLAVTFETSQELQALMRDRGTLIKGMQAQINQVHREMQQQIRYAVYEEYEKERRARMSAGGRDSRRPERKFEKALLGERSPVDILSGSARGFISDFTRLDTVVTRKGKPYWRSLEYGFSYTVRGGLFYSNVVLGAGGTFSAPGARTNDPRLPQNMRKGMEFHVGFEGYNVIDPTLKTMRSELVREYFNRIVDAAGFPPAIRAAAKKFSAGGVQTRYGNFAGGSPGADPRKPYYGGI